MINESDQQLFQLQAASTILMSVCGLLTDNNPQLLYRPDINEVELKVTNRFNIKLCAANWEQQSNAGYIFETVGSEQCSALASNGQDVEDDYQIEEILQTISDCCTTQADIDECFRLLKIVIKLLAAHSEEDINRAM